MFEENKRLKKKIELLNDEVATKQAIIKTLDQGANGKRNNGDLEAIQGLKQANERLMQQLVELQKSQKYSGGGSDLNSHGRYLQSSGISDTQYGKLDMI